MSMIDPMEDGDVAFDKSSAELLKIDSGQLQPNDDSKASPARRSTQAALRRYLKELEQKGLQLDAKRLRKNVCSQFPFYQLWIREYIVNAFDAQAKSCW